MGLVLLALFALCVLASQQVAVLRYLSDPPSVHCPSVISHYGDTLKEMAAAEWFEQRTDLLDRRGMDLDTDVSRTGTYSCFCYNELVNLD